MLLASALALTASAWMTPALPQDAKISNRNLRAWYDEMAEAFDDEAAVTQAGEWIGKSLVFHGYEEFEKADGLMLNLSYTDLVNTVRYEEPFAQVQGRGSLYLMPGMKSAWVQKVPEEMKGGEYASVRYVHDGETTWTFARGHDNHRVDVAQRAYGSLMRRRILCGLPFFLRDQEMKLAAVPETGEVVLGDEEGKAQSFKTHRIRVMLSDPVTLGVMSSEGRPEPVQIFHVEFFQDTFQIAAIDYLMFRTGNLDPSSPYFEYRHEFSRDFVDETFHLPTRRHTNLSLNGMIWREQTIDSVQVGPAPTDFFIQGWKVLPRDPLGGD